MSERNPRSHYIQNGQGLLLVLLGLFILGFSNYYLLATIRRNNQALRDYQQTQAAHLAILVEARDRLLYYTLSSTDPNERNGTLPCPDKQGDGVAGSCTAADAQSAGLYPYKTINNLIKKSSPSDDTPPRSPDAQGDCLWLAISPSLRRANDPLDNTYYSTGHRPINPDSIGEILFNNTPVFAVLIAPGPALATQSAHCSPDGTPCDATNTAILCPPVTQRNDYLESLLNTNNAGTSGAFSYSRTPNALDLTTLKCVLQNTITDTTKIGPPCQNDVILALTRQDLIKPLLRTVLERLTQDPAGSGVDAIAALQALLVPYSAPVFLNTVRNTNPAAFDVALFQDIKTSIAPTTALNCYRSDAPPKFKDNRPAWLCGNDWYRFIRYQPAEQSLSIKLDTDNPSSYACTLSLTTRLVRCQ